MTEDRVSERSDLDTGEAEEWRSHAPMDVEMVMTTAAIPTTAETADPTLFAQIDRNKQRKRIIRNGAPATPSNWRSNIERTM
jgi:hypothetical protein